MSQFSTEADSPEIVMPDSQMDSEVVDPPISEVSDSELYRYESLDSDGHFAMDGDDDYQSLLRTLDGTTTAETENHTAEWDASNRASVSLESMDDFLRDYFIKHGMNCSLDRFNSEWFHRVSHGEIDPSKIAAVPPVYVENQRLESQLEIVLSERNRLQTMASTAQGTWEKFRKQRDGHRMHHRRVAQEKDKLFSEVKRLREEIHSLQPQLDSLTKKYERAVNERLMIRIERDKLKSKCDAVQKTIDSLRVDPKEKEKKPEKSAKKSSVFPPLSAPFSFVPHDTFDPLNYSHVSLSKTFKGHLSAISSLCFHPKRPIIGTASDDGTWKLWGVPNGDLIVSGGDHKDWISDMEFHPNGTSLCTASGDSTVKVWDFAKGKCLKTFQEHSHAVWCLSYHYTGDFLVSGSQDKTLRLFDLATLSARCTFRGHADTVNSVQFQPYAHTVASGSADKTVSLWDATSGFCTQTFYGHKNAVNCVRFNSIGDNLVSCDADGVIKLWDLRMAAERQTLRASSHPLNSVRFDLSGTTVAAASEDGKVHLFDLTAGRTLGLSGHEGGVQCLAFDPSGASLASGGSDCSFRLWTLGAAN